MRSACVTDTSLNFPSFCEPARYRARKCKHTRHPGCVLGRSYECECKIHAVPRYAFNSSVFVSKEGVLEGVIFGQHLNFSTVVDHSRTPPTPLATALRAEPIGAGSNPGCRWLDDGSDLELIYFDGLKSDNDFTTPANRLRFMGSATERLPLAV